MSKRDRGLILALALAAAAPAWSQVDEVVVTGARISGDDYSGIPAVVLQRRADFLVQRVRLTNDTRAADARNKELHQTIRDMVSDAAKKLRETVGAKCRIQVSGLANRVSWQRSDISELTLYIPYQVELAECE